MSFRLSVRPHGTTWLRVDGFKLNLIFVYFQKSLEKIQVTFKSNGTPHKVQ